MAVKFLQNHPEEQTFPVNYRVRLPYGKTERKGFFVMLRGLMVLPIFATIFLLGLLYFEGSEKLTNEEQLKFYVVLGSFLAACLFLAFWLGRIDSGAARREQLRYYKVAGIDRLDDKKRSGLQLDAAMSYARGDWTETLEYIPAEVRFQKPEKEMQKFPIMGVLRKEDAIQGLDNDWGVLTKSGYEKMRDELFEGMHGAGFASIMAADPDDKEAKEERAAMCERLAGLIQCDDPEYVESCVRSEGGRPPQLIWGFDLWRVVPMARLAFMAGLISEDEAWRDILKACHWLHGIFPDLESYLQNLRLGHAYWCNSFEKCTERKKACDGFLAGEPNRIPMRDLKWDLVNDVSFPTPVRQGLPPEEKEAEKTIGFV